MKKIFLTVLLMSAALCIYAQTGVIRELSGDVELKHAGSSSFVAASAGSRVAQDTVVSTGFRSTTIIEIGSSTITVRPLTRLTLSEIYSSSGSETLNVNLQAGRVRVDVNPPAGTRASMAVRSPIATASVRGTSFEFDTRNLYVSHGQVSFIGNQGKKAMQVNAGSSSRVEADGRIADPIVLKSSGLIPPAPAGSDSSSGSSGAGHSFSGGVFAITLKYDDLPIY